jgi:lipoprotein-anchoring transpeptidase ErfK/SrfK
MRMWNGFFILLCFLVPFISYGGIPSHIPATGEKVIIIDPNAHAFGAYSPGGVLLRSGTATAGSRWCRDLHRPCKTRSGSFRIHSLGSSGCKSHKFPLPRGGAPMPYCMFFNGGQGIHGSYEVVRGNISHGCVRVHVGDAHWLRFNFAGYGTRVVVRPY